MKTSSQLTSKGKTATRAVKTANFPRKKKTKTKKQLANLQTAY